MADEARLLYHSFLVRFWFEPTDGSWHGELEHVQGAWRVPLDHLDELPPLLRSRFDPPLALADRATRAVERNTNG